MGEPHLSLMVQPQEFFREKVSEALQNQRVDLGDELEFYVVNLLCEFIAPGKLDTLNGELSALETPLALMLAQAVEAPPAQRLRIFKYLGDTSLYISGFFQDYFNRKTFDIGYYIQLGSSAYGNVATLVRDAHGDEHFQAMFGDLARRFHELVEVLAEVSETPGNAKPLDLLAVYDRWTKTNSERLRRALNKAGIIPLPVKTREQQ